MSNTARGSLFFYETKLSGNISRSAKIKVRDIIKITVAIAVMLVFITIEWIFFHFESAGAEEQRHPNAQKDA